MRTAVPRQADSRWGSGRRTRTTTCQLGTRVPHSHRTGAFEDFDDQRYTQFALNCGLALEILLTAALHQVNPLLIVARECGPLGRLWLVRSDTHGDPPPADLRTVGLVEAGDLAKMLGIRVSTKDLKQIAAARNSAAHIGAYASSPTPADLLVSVIRNVSDIAITMQPQAVAPFGGHSGFADSQVRSYKSAVDMEVADRLEQAKRRMEDRGPLDEGARDALADVARKTWRRSDVTRQLVACPACGLPEYLSGDAEIVDYHLDVDHRGGVVLGIRRRCRL